MSRVCASTPTASCKGVTARLRSAAPRTAMSQRTHNYSVNRRGRVPVARQYRHQPGRPTSGHPVHAPRSRRRSNPCHPTRTTRSLAPHSRRSSAARSTLTVATPSTAAAASSIASSSRRRARRVRRRSNRRHRQRRTLEPAPREAATRPVSAQQLVRETRASRCKGFVPAACTVSGTLMRNYSTGQSVTVRVLAAGARRVR